MQTVRIIQNVLADKCFSQRFSQPQMQAMKNVDKNTTFKFNLSNELLELPIRKRP
jgi:hypothetical protein